MTRDISTRRQVFVEDNTWTGVKLIAAKTGENISDVVARALAAFVTKELPRVLKV